LHRHLALIARGEETIFHKSCKFSMNSIISYRGTIAFFFYLPFDISFLNTTVKVKTASLRKHETYITIWQLRILLKSLYERWYTRDPFLTLTFFRSFFHSFIPHLSLSLSLSRLLFQTLTSFCSHSLSIFDR